MRQELTLAALVLSQAAMAQTEPGLPSLAPPLAPAVLVRHALSEQPRQFIDLDLPAGGETYLSFSELRSTAALQALSLIDPAGRVTWRRTPAELRRLPAGQTARAELGDVYFLPPLLTPVAGRWRLLVERMANDRTPAQVQFSYRVSARFSLALWAHPGEPSVGQPQLLTLRASDMGNPVTAPTPLLVRVLDARGQAVLETRAEPSLPTPGGRQDSGEPGAHFAQWQPTQGGHYRIEAHWQPSPAQARLSVTRELQVGAGEAELRFLGASTEPGAQCLQALNLRYALNLVKAEPGATYALNLQVRGSQSSKLIGAQVEFSGQNTTASVRLSSQTLRSLGLPLAGIESSRLLRFTPSFKTLAVGPAVDLAGALPPQTPLCP